MLRSVKPLLPVACPFAQEGAKSRSVCLHSTWHAGQRARKLHLPQTLAQSQVELQWTRIKCLRTRVVASVPYESRIPTRPNRSRFFSTLSLVTTSDGLKSKGRASF